MGEDAHGRAEPDTEGSAATEDARPAGTAAADARPAGTAAADARPAGTAATDRTAAADGRPAEAQPAEARPAGTAAADARPAGTAAANRTAAADGRPAETRPAEARPAETRPAEARPAAGQADVGPRPAELSLPSLADIEAAAQRVAQWAVRTPLVRLNDDAVDTPAGPAEIFLKLENLQPIGAFKIRGAGNCLAQADPATLANGIYTASAGNMAQGVAWHARRLGIACTAVVPQTAPEAKLSAITRLGADFLKVPFDEWWQVMIDRSHPAYADRLFVHPFADRAVMAGNGTIGLEILEDLPDVDAVIVPFGGGGLAAGIAAAVKAVRPQAKVFASEADTAAPLAAAFAAGRPVAVDYAPSFVDGIGSKEVTAVMWPLVSRILDGSLTVPVPDAAASVRLLLERNRVLAEGAGASSVAAARAGLAGAGKIVAVLSGGNIDLAKVATILSGNVP